MAIVTLADGLVRILAPNPSPMTFKGTNTYILPGPNPILIDPGPDDAQHLAAIMEVLGRRALSAILATHSHRDHTALLPALRQATGAPVYAFGPTGTGRSAIMARLAENGTLGGGEGADPDFLPDHTLAHGEVVPLAGAEITALHTPGHFGNHMCFAWQGALFSGDHIMDWSTTLISPPDGDLTDFMASCDILLQRDDGIYYPGHGDPIGTDGTAPQHRVEALRRHRLGREAEITRALEGGPATAAELAARIYTDVDPRLIPAAERNVLAHLIDLTSRGHAAPAGPLSQHAKFHLQ